MRAKGKRVQPRIKPAGKRILPYVGWPCRILIAVFALLMGLSAWQIAVYRRENRQERRFMEEMLNNAVALVDTAAGSPSS